MATREDYANWIVKNADKKGTPEFDTVAKAYEASTSASANQSAPKETTIGQDIKQGAINFGAGLVRGAGSIGSTLLAPIDIASDALAGKGLSLESNRQRRADIDAGLTSLVGSDPKSLLYQGGKLGGEIAGTAGVGGALAKGAQAAGAAPSFVNSLATGGFRAGANPGVVNMLTRTAGGAITGGASAGLVNPEDAGAGALIGGALPVAVKLAGMAGSGLKSAASGAAKHSLGMSTGAGSESVGAAYQAGKSGGTNFIDNMRGNVPMTDVLDSAKSALSRMRMERAAQYRSGMADVSADKSIIDFAPIDKAVSSIKSMGNYKGQVINKNASGAVDEIAGLVNQWKGLDPTEFHTPEGLDALKQAISDVRDTTQFGTAARKAADTAYNAVKSEITAQAPGYAKVMKDYSQASETLGEIERALSLGNKAAADTSMRKLQSLMRNNVNTNFGNRLDLAKQLEKSGGEILPAVAGQAMSSWTPRGLAGLAASGGAAGAMLANPAALLALPATSPRLVGELAYGVGAANRGIGQATNALSARLPQLSGNGGGAIGMNRLAQTLPVIAAPALTANQR